MNNLKKTLFKNILLALSIVVLYSPALIGLSPADPSIIRAGLSIILGVVLGYGFVKVNILDQKPQKLLTAADVLTIEDNRAVLSKLADSRVFGKTVAKALKQLERADKYQKNIPPIIAHKFPEGSMSFDKFNGSVMRSIAAVNDNCKSVAMRIQMTDEKEYREIERVIKTGAYKHDDIPDDIQEEQYEIYQKNKKNMEDILNTNEQLLLKLEALSLEISSMNLQDLESDNDAIVDEIETLIDETKYYK